MIVTYSYYNGLVGDFRVWPDDLKEEVKAYIIKKNQDDHPDYGFGFEEDEPYFMLPKGDDPNGYHLALGECDFDEYWSASFDVPEGPEACEEEECQTVQDK